MTSEEERLLAALAGMCVQYLERDEFLDHLFMGAGEDAIDTLAAYGFVEVEARGGTWTEAGKAFLASH